MNSTQYSSYDLERQRQQLETLVQQPPQTASPLRKALQTWGMAIVNFLTADNSPRIRQQMQNGLPVWRVYDPLSNQTKRFYSEAELLAWLEGRYYE